MRPLARLRYDASRPLARAHPLAKIAGALALMLALFASVDPLVPLVVLAACIAALSALGVATRPLAVRIAPLLAAAAGIGIFNGLVAQDAISGIAVALRVAAIALVGVLSLATIEPPDLADALIEHVRVPPRFAVGAVAAFRLAPLFADEWERIALARRARGIDVERTVVDRLVSFPSRTFTLLVGAIRRATALALAMDARGFATRDCRTIVRPRPFVRRDLALVLGCVVIAAGSLATSVATGLYRTPFGG